MKNKLLLIFLLVTGSFIKLFGQYNLVCSDSITINSPTAVSIDRAGMVYYADKNGNLFKYNAELNLINEYSAQQTGRIDLIDAWNPLRILLFYQPRQEYTLLNRFLVETSSRYSLQEITDYAALVSSSLDNNIWIADLAEFGLKKFDTQFNQIVLSTPFDLLLNTKDYNLTHLRAYKNMLFISDFESGILVFDNLGNYIKTISGKGINYFNFLDDEIYFLLDKQLKFVNIFNGKERILENGRLKQTEFVLVSEKNIFVFRENFLKRCSMIKK